MPKLFSCDDVESALLVRRLIADGYDLTDDAAIVGENILLDLFVKAPDGQISRLTLESGEIEFVCSHESRLAAVVEGQNGNYLTAGSFLDEWQELHQKEIEPLQRLVPTLPYIFGGEYAAKNLHSVGREDALGYLVGIFIQTKDLSDGTKVTFKIVDL